VISAALPDAVDESVSWVGESDPASALSGIENAFQPWKVTKGPAVTP